MTKMGLELEWPLSQNGERTLRRPADGSGSIPRGIDVWRGQPTHDPTVGLEIVSDPLRPSEMGDWYRENVDRVERGGDILEPCGYLQSGGSTAGLHTHISPLSTEKAQWLYQESDKDWLRAFVCSTIYESGPSGPETPVLRGTGPCRMSFDEGHFSVVNNRGGDHWEWRLPEPMIPKHVDHLATFVDKLVESGAESAKTYALEVMSEKPHQITSMRRAKACGIDGKPQHSHGPAGLEVTRDPHTAPSIPRKVANWLSDVSLDETAPKPYGIECPSDYPYDALVAFECEDESLPHTVDGVTFHCSHVLDMDLTSVTDREIVGDVRDVINQYRENQQTGVKGLETIKKNVHKV